MLPPPPLPLAAPNSPQAPHQLTGRLAAVTCHFNPRGYRRLRENYFRFRDALRGCPLYTIEVSFDGTFYLPADWQFKATSQNLMWQKEALINEAVRRLPDRFDQIAWIDADLLFLNADWAQATSELLNQFPVVQLFDNCHYITAQGRWEYLHPSLLRKRREGLKEHGQPGGAWAARRELLDKHGLFAENVIGGGDANFSDAIFGELSGYVTRRSPPGLNAVYDTWARRVFADVEGRVGCTPGDVVHLYHGTRQNRQYIERTAILREESFDPRQDLRLNGDGLLEWCSNKPQLHQRIRDYFSSRREDE